MSNWKEEASRRASEIHAQQQAIKRQKEAGERRQEEIARQASREQETMDARRIADGKMRLKRFDELRVVDILSRINKEVLDGLAEKPKVDVVVTPYSAAKNIELAVRIPNQDKISIRTTDAYVSRFGFYSIPIHDDNGGVFYRIRRFGFHKVGRDRLAAYNYNEENDYIHSLSIGFSSPLRGDAPTHIDIYDSDTVVDMNMLSYLDEQREPDDLRIESISPEINGRVISSLPKGVRLSFPYEQFNTNKLSGYITEVLHQTNAAKLLLMPDWVAQKKQFKSKMNSLRLQKGRII